MKIKMSDLILCVILILLYAFYSLDKGTTIIPKIVLIQRIIVVVVGVYLLPKLKYILVKENYKLIFSMLMFGGFIFVATYLNKNTVIKANVMLNAIVDILFIFEIFLVFIYCAYKEKIKLATETLWWFLLALAIITDISILLGKVSKGPDGEIVCLIGSKFSVSYLHIQLIAVYLLTRFKYDRFRKRYLTISILYTIFIAYFSNYLECNTGIIGCIILALFVILLNRNPNSLLKFFSKPYAFLIALLGCILMLFCYDILLNNNLVENFIIHVLQRDTTLTGRTNIYEVFWIRTAGNWSWGYGYENSSRISRELFGYFNTQNGLTEWIMQIGLPGTISMIYLFIVVFKKLSMCQHSHFYYRKYIIPALSVIYVFTLLAAIEITISLTFFFWLAFLYGWTCLKEKKYIELQ